MQEKLLVIICHCSLGLEVTLKSKKMVLLDLITGSIVCFGISLWTLMLRYLQQKDYWSTFDILKMNICASCNLILVHWFITFLLYEYFVPLPTLLANLVTLSNVLIIGYFRFSITLCNLFAYFFVFHFDYFTSNISEKAMRIIAIFGSLIPTLIIVLCDSFLTGFTFHPLYYFFSEETEGGWVSIGIFDLVCGRFLVFLSSLGHAFLKFRYAEHIDKSGYIIMICCLLMAVVVLVVYIIFALDLLNEYTKELMLFVTLFPALFIPLLIIFPHQRLRNFIKNFFEPYLEHFQIFYDAYFVLKLAYSQRNRVNPANHSP